MQKNTYQIKFQEMFPRIETISQDDEVNLLSLACSTMLQERYVTKSDKLIELKKQMELAQKLKKRCDVIRYKFPVCNANLPRIDCSPLNYSKYLEEDIWGQILSIAQQIEEKNSYVQYGELARKICCNVDSFYDSISIAVEQEDKGSTGEESVAEYIKRVTSSKVLQSVVLPAASEDMGKTAESDLIVITANGIYVCEVKNYGKAGQTLSIGENGSIRKLTSKGHILKEYTSPFLQNDNHCKAIEQVLQASDIHGIPIYPVVVIANTDVAIQNHSNMFVVDTYQLADMIRNAEKTAVLNDIEVGNVYKAIKEKRIEERSFPVLEIPYSLYDNSLDVLQRYADKQDEWVNECSQHLTKWAMACNNLWKEMNPDALIAEHFAEQKRRKRKKIVSFLVCILVLLLIALIIWLIYTFREQIAILLGIATIIGIFKLCISSGTK